MRVRNFVAAMAVMALLGAGLAFAGGEKESAQPAAKTATGVALPSTEIFAKYSPEITINFSGSSPAGAKWAEGETYEDNRWMKLLKDRLGLNIKYAWVASSPQYAEKVNLTIASGDIPDAMHYINSLQLAKLVDAGLINADLEAVYKSYVSPTLLKDYDHAGREGTFGAATYNGKLAAFPYPFSSMGQGAMTLVLRQDWMKDLNLTAPKTHAEMFKIFDTMMEKKGATMALLTTKNLDWMRPFFWSFGAYPWAWIKDASGKIVYGSAQPQIKAALTQLNYMYKKGYLDKEFAAKDGTKAMEMLTSGKAIGNFDGWEPGGTVVNMVSADPKVDFQTYPLPSPDGKPVIQMHPSFGNNFYVVKKGYKNPEAVMKMISFLAEETYGPGAKKDFYTTYIQDYDKGIAPFTWGPWFCISVEKNFNTYKKFKANTAYDQLNAEEAWIWDTIKKWQAGDPKQWWMSKFFYPPTSHYRILEDVLANKWYMLDAFYGPPLTSMVEKKALVDKVFLEMAIKMIMGDESIDKFDSYVAQMNSAGLAEITTDINAWAAKK